MVLLLDSFVQLVLLHQLWARLDVGRCCFIRQVEEIDVGLHKTFGKEFNSNRLFGHFLVQLEVALLLKVLSTARQVGSRGSLLHTSNLARFNRGEVSCQTTLVLLPQQLQPGLRHQRRDLFQFLLGPQSSGERLIRNLSD